MLSMTLGDQWVVYSAEGVGGISLLSLLMLEAFGLRLLHVADLKPLNTT